ncbi:unnamed protein product [Cladocopium goreaui]|uniref:Uncharacterized protein n=1 Tax=Cladocopium goreaui TaxID=2562237 RepID=A0A9P1BNJ1_9DINO|nr:unnamed protein product [Cladocopium goreaui]
MEKREQDTLSDQEGKVDRENKTTRDLIWESFLRVTANDNIGKWLNDEYGNHEKMTIAIDRVVLSRDAPVEHRCVSLVPTQSLNELWVSLDQLDYSCNAKHGSSLVL